MKNLAVISLLFVAMACSNQKENIQEIESHEEVVNRSEEEEKNPEGNRAVGIVHVSETECPLYLEVELTENTVTMYPMNLEEKFKQEGFKIKFTYELSRGAQPENCDIDMVVSLSEVALMR